MMLVQTLFYFFVVTLFTLVQSGPVLFDRAFIKYGRHGKRQMVYDFHHIDNKTVPTDKHLIIVKTKTMEIIYTEAVRNLKNLQDLYLSNCGVQKIETKAFFNLPNLTVLHLEDNHIEEVKKGVFNGLTVTILSLQRNEIKQIDGEAFDDMPLLFKIKLNSNRLKSWDSGWFKNTPRLTELYFRRNKLSYLPRSAFVNVKGSHLVDGISVVDTKIFLSKNKLGELVPESFYDLERISQLYLDRNNIQVVPDGAFRDLTDVDVIYLARNKISEINGNAFPKVRNIGILDLSSNLLECLPYGLVTVANVTNLEKNNGTCDCIKEFRAKLQEEKRSCEISYSEDLCTIT